MKKYLKNVNIIFYFLALYQQYVNVHSMYFVCELKTTLKTNTAASDILIMLNKKILVTVLDLT